MIFYAFAAFGLAYIVGHATITKVIRERLYDMGAEFEIVTAPMWIRRRFVDLLECPACFGFWTGIAASFAFGPFLHVGGIPGAFLWGCYTAGTNFTLAKITRLIE